MYMSTFDYIESKCQLFKSVFLHYFLTFLKVSLCVWLETDVRLLQRRNKAIIKLLNHCSCQLMVSVFTCVIQTVFLIVWLSAASRI